MRPVLPTQQERDRGGVKSEIPAGGVVVGTDGSAHAELAVLWAAAQAASEGRPLDLVHAYGVAGVGELPWVGGPGLDRAVLAHAVRDSAAFSKLVDQVRAA